MTLDPHNVAYFLLTTSVGGLMMVAGVGKHALEWRRRRRVCPSCGRQIEGRTCRCRS
jgi:NADH pyrophosphatase NudC (nudix superfamily)